MGKKVGVISNYDIQNYGNRLQNYAVCNVLEKLGFEPYTLIKSDMSYEPYVLMGKKARLKYLIYSILNPAKAKAMRRQFGYPNRVNHFYAFEKLFPHMDIRKNDEWRSLDYYALGSDQVLHPFYVEKMEELSVSNLSEEQLGRTVMISPSFGVSNIDTELYPTYRSFLSKVNSLSCREKEGAELMQRICGREVPVVIDPTMLLTAEEWRRVSASIQAKKPYILKFFLGDEPQHTTAAIDAYAKEHDLEVRKLLDEQDVDTYFAGPSEFLWLVDHAQYICTDSFHGSVFSILFHKKFFVFPRSGMGKTMGSRITTLLDTYGLENRLVDEKIFWEQEVDYGPVEQILNRKREEYREYLADSLKGDEEDVSC